MPNLTEMHAEWEKAGEYEVSDEELLILKIFDLVLKHSPEDEIEDRKLQLDLLLDDINESN